MMLAVAAFPEATERLSHDSWPFAAFPKATERLCHHDCWLATQRATYNYFGQAIARVYHKTFTENRDCVTGTCIYIPIQFVHR
jgi:hypothetical protein